ncbi:MAG: hypothetical protein ACLTJE_14925 [Enterocloster bolteae]|uniref:hypothetical protein n=1 Tax=Enterocloster bolteae TaxID=208479 RepID=UPI003991628A
MDLAAVLRAFLQSGPVECGYRTAGKAILGEMAALKNINSRAGGTGHSRMLTIRKARDWLFYDCIRKLYQKKITFVMVGTKYLVILATRIF